MSHLTHYRSFRGRFYSPYDQTNFSRVREDYFSSTVPWIRWQADMENGEREKERQGMTVKWWTDDSPQQQQQSTNPQPPVSPADLLECCCSNWWQLITFPLLPALPGIPAQCTRDLHEIPGKIILLSRIFFWKINIPTFLLAIHLMFHELINSWRDTITNQLKAAYLTVGWSQIPQPNGLVKRTGQKCVIHRRHAQCYNSTNMLCF